LESCASIGDHVETTDDAGEDGGDEHAEFLHPSCCAFIFCHVSPSAFAKWSSTDPIEMSKLSFLAFISVHFCPRDFAKWSSTDPETQIELFINIMECLSFSIKIILDLQSFLVKKYGTKVIFSGPVTF
jgi:hypothetical protein